MVVRIKTGKSIRGALSYNERKISAGKAELILASRFACDLSDLGFTEKLTRFERLNGKCPKVKTNTLHLSLNFSPYDNLDKEKLQMIAWEYMKQIGFGDQPFLVYHHEDSGHPHLHIVSSTIRPDGRPIRMHNIGRLKSEPARKAIEKEFDLIPAESMKKEISLPLTPINLEMAIYGQCETKQKISNIVCEVVSSYHFQSVDELNAVLKQYNVIADTGKPGTKMYANKGLAYCLLDKNGNKVGIPIKASSIYTSPTLSSLENKFNKEITRKHLYTNYTSKVIGELLKYPKTLTEEQLNGWLARRKINYELIKNAQGVVTDVRFVDNMKKVVLCGSDINMQVDQFIGRIKTPLKSAPNSNEINIAPEKEKTIQESLLFSDTSLRWVRDMLSPNYDPTGNIPEFLKRKNRKRKRKRPSN